MAVAFDAFSTSNESDLAVVTWTHTPVGTPKGVLVYVDNVAGSDLITGVTYGGVALSEVSGSPNVKATAEAGSVHAFFLGSGIPTGAQSVVVTGTDITRKLCHCYSTTAAANTKIQDIDATINSDALENPSATLSLSGKSCFCSLSAFSGVPAITTDCSPLSGWTNRNEDDLGANGGLSYSYDTIGTPDVTIGWTQTLEEDAVCIGVAITEDLSTHLRSPSGGVAYGGRGY